MPLSLCLLLKITNRLNHRLWRCDRKRFNRSGVVQNVKKAHPEISQLWPVSFGENWYSKVYAGHSLSGYHFWARGYCVNTVGLNEEEVRAYIRNQESHDKVEDQYLLPLR